MGHSDGNDHHEGLQITGWWCPHTRPERFIKFVPEGHLQTRGSASQVPCILLLRLETQEAVFEEIEEIGGIVGSTVEEGNGDQERTEQPPVQAER